MQGCVAGHMGPTISVEHVAFIFKCSRFTWYHVPLKHCEPLAQRCSHITEDWKFQPLLSKYNNV